MLQNPKDLRLQACLLILFVCSLLTGLLVAVAEVFPRTLLPEHLGLSREGARMAFLAASTVTAVVASYVLIMGRSLLSLHRIQAQELSTAEQRFRSLFYQSPDAVFGVDKDGYSTSLNPVAQAIVGLGESDLGVTHYRDVLTDEAM